MLALDLPVGQVLDEEKKTFCGNRIEHEQRASTGFDEALEQVDTVADRFNIGSLLFFTTTNRLIWSPTKTLTVRKTPASDDERRDSEKKRKRKREKINRLVANAILAQSIAAIRFTVHG